MIPSEDSTIDCHSAYSDQGSDMTPGFNDHFSKLAPIYAKHRPRYPEALFELLASAAPGRQQAWDAGTGSGQAAVRLGEYFAEVIGTDGSEEQLRHAQQHPHVRYRLEVAERTGFASGTLDLVTSAQAAHWFRLDEFYSEAK